MNLHDLTPDTSTCEREPATRCEACGEAFMCGAALAGCWCAEVKVSEAVRAELRTRYQRCLCRACLQRFAEGKGDGVVNTQS